MIDYPPAWFGIKEQPPDDGTCACGEDQHEGFNCDEIPVARGYEQEKDVA